MKTEGGRRRFEAAKERMQTALERQAMEAMKAQDEAENSGNVGEGTEDGQMKTRGGEQQKG